MKGQRSRWEWAELTQPIFGLLREVEESIERDLSDQCHARAVGLEMAPGVEDIRKDGSVVVGFLGDQSANIRRRLIGIIQSVRS